jgi:hypothetical protein
LHLHSNLKLKSFSFIFSNSKSCDNFGPDKEKQTIEKIANIKNNALAIIISFFKLSLLLSLPLSIISS